MSDMDIVVRLSTLAAQENCDGEPWDTMQDASMEIRLLRSRLERAEGLLRETNHRMKQHKASLLDYCPACRDQVKRNDAFLRGD